MQKINIYFWITVTVVSLSVIPFSIQAGSIDGSQNLLCAPQLVIECGPEGKCEQAMAASVNLPNFFQIDFSARELSAITE